MARDSEFQTALIRADSPAPPSGLRHRWTLPPDLLSEAVRRLRLSALLYAVAYFLAGLLPSLIVPEARATLTGNPVLWVPAVLSICTALVVAALASSPRLSDRMKVTIGLAFEVLGSFGIAAAEYHHIRTPIVLTVGQGGFGLSWVSAWVLLFSVVVPTSPRIATLTAALSVTAVPLAYAAGVALGSNVPLQPGMFFFSLVFPYCVVVLMVHVGSRIVSGLGAAVRKAREMGSYRLVKRLGEGGMGEVWRAEHRMLVRPAAIKLIRPTVFGGPDGRGQELLRRFEREAQATALLRSVHTVELYDFGVADDGTFYYVMELLDGFDLEELVQQFGPVPPARAIHLLKQVCESLAEAHDAGLIHRDIKPANLYICRYGREVDFMKVLDFGLVKRGGVPDERGDELTGQDRLAAGTPAFMSPEQAGADPVDGRSDIYSLGCVAYWLLTGTPVFKGRSPVGTMLMHVQAEPEPPSRRAPQPIPAELERIVLACLAKDADARPQSADELARRLKDVPMDDEWTAASAREWWDTRRPAAGRVSIPM